MDVLTAATLRPLRWARHASFGIMDSLSLHRYRCNGNRVSKPVNEMGIAGAVLRYPRSFRLMAGGSGEPRLGRFSFRFSTPAHPPPPTSEAAAAPSPRASAGGWIIGSGKNDPPAGRLHYSSGEPGQPAGSRGLIGPSARFVRTGCAHPLVEEDRSGVWLQTVAFIWSEHSWGVRVRWPGFFGQVN